MKRSILHEPAFVLHRYDWSESSLILEVFTRHHGRIALVAKGAKRPSSNFRPVLLPLQPLQVGFGGDAEIRTLKAAEWSGGHVMPTGDALLSGYYLNELLIRLLARDDPHPALFDAYGGVVEVLATARAESAQATVQAAALRAFELLLLREVGLLPVLDAQTLTLAALLEHGRYALVAEAGLREADASEAALAGSLWRELQAALSDSAPFTATLRTVAELPAGASGALRSQLRNLLNYHCGVATLRTRQLMRELQNL
ncbi:MAG: DNA repair protein RecO [Comamonadaceae bacterium]|nr:MAG: DNA repair protein RecO [Comamonadaceae bacterium]